MSTKIRKFLITLGALAALALGGAALAGAASNGDENEKADTSKPIAGDSSARAEKAALAATHGGKVNQTELDGENGATYEVEVAKTDGSQVDVRLDDNFKVVVIEPDGEGR